MIGGGVANGYNPEFKKDGTILCEGYIVTSRKPASGIQGCGATEFDGVHGSEGEELQDVPPESRY